MVTFFPSDPETPRVFTDSSVIIAGCASRTGASNALLTLCEMGLLRPVVCPYVINETERNLANKLLRAMPDYQQLKAKIDWEIVADPDSEAVASWLDVITPKDAPVLAAAVAANPHRLVTLDAQHFIKAANVAPRSGLAICTPGELIREIRKLLAQGFKGLA
ncbi:MAG: PIN domain-containing protein [Anaerolineae bacterium]|nr:PIN domain-containing protein [Anaerolineae bacterium]